MRFPELAPTLSKRVETKSHLIPLAEKIFLIFFIKSTHRK